MLALRMMHTSPLQQQHPDYASRLKSPILSPERNSLGIEKMRRLPIDMCEARGDIASGAGSTRCAGSRSQTLCRPSQQPRQRSVICKLIDNVRNFPRPPDPIA